MRSRSKSKLEAIGHELKVNPPKILAHTARKFGVQRAEKQREAILLSKARKAGVRVRPQGSGTFANAEIKKGYRVLETVTLQDFQEMDNYGDESSEEKRLGRKIES